MALWRRSCPGRATAAEASLVRVVARGQGVLLCVVGPAGAWGENSVVMRRLGGSREGPNPQSCATQRDKTPTSLAHCLRYSLVF